MHPCAFFSRKSAPAEQHYDFGNQELLAVKMVLEEWRHWLEGAKQLFVVWTDHKNLEYIRSAKRLSFRQARWALFLNHFDFSLSYRPGSLNVKPDALSHQFQSDSGPTLPESVLPSKVVIGVITLDIEAKVKQGQADHPAPSACPENRLFDPANLDSQVLQWGHSSRLACHPGVRRTLALLRQRFWWGSMEEDTNEFVAACQICSQHNSARHAPSGLLQPLPIPPRPLSGRGVSGGLGGLWTERALLGPISSRISIGSILTSLVGRQEPSLEGGVLSQIQSSHNIFIVLSFLHVLILMSFQNSATSPALHHLVPRIP